MKYSSNLLTLFDLSFRINIRSPINISIALTEAHRAIRRRGGDAALAASAYSTLLCPPPIPPLPQTILLKLCLRLVSCTSTGSTHLHRRVCSKYASRLRWTSWRSTSRAAPTWSSCPPSCVRCERDPYCCAVARTPSHVRTRRLVHATLLGSAGLHSGRRPVSFDSGTSTCPFVLCCAQAMARGLQFELSYSPLLREPSLRRDYICNAHHMLTYLKSKVRVRVHVRHYLMAPLP